jgi:hypothetical protein
MKPQFAFTFGKHATSVVAYLPFEWRTTKGSTNEVGTGSVP